MANVDMTFVAFAVLISSLHKQRGASNVPIRSWGLERLHRTNFLQEGRQKSGVHLADGECAPMGWLATDTWSSVPTCDAAVDGANVDAGHRAASFFRGPKQLEINAVGTAAYPAGLRCKWSPESYSARVFEGWVGSWTTV